MRRTLPNITKSVLAQKQHTFNLKKNLLSDALQFAPCWLDHLHGNTVKMMLFSTVWYKTRWHAVLHPRNLEDDKLPALQTTICVTDDISISLLWWDAIFYTALFWGDAIKRRQMISWAVWQLKALPFTICALTLQTMRWCLCRSIDERRLHSSQYLKKKDYEI